MIDSSQCLLDGVNVAVHGVKVAVTSHGHVQRINSHAGFPGNDPGGGGAAVALGKNRGQIIFTDNADQVFQLLSGGFTAGFFLHRFQNGQIKRLSKVGKAVMKRHQFPTFKAGQAGFSIALQCVQIFQQSVQISGKCVRIFGISLGEPPADVSGHYLGVFRGKPDSGVVLVVVIFMTVVVFFLHMQEGDTLGRIDDIRIIQNAVQKILQPCAGDHDDLGGLRRLYLTDVQGVVVQAGDAFRHQSGDGEGVSAQSREVNSYTGRVVAAICAGCA